MTCAVQTHIGYIRDENQDRVGMREFGENRLLLVCDGMGGERSGSKASTMASEIFFEHFEEGYTEDLDAYGVRVAASFFGVGCQFRGLYHRQNGLSEFWNGYHMCGSLCQ